MAERGTCFVIMPFGKKKDATGQEIDFDLIYRDLLQEPIEDAGLAAVRCDEIQEAGSIREDMFLHIARSEVAIVDITTLNPNVFYELGVRHALRKNVTVLVRKRGGSIPFNVGDMRTVEYPAASGSWRESRDAIERFITHGLAADEVDSPIFPVLTRVEAETVDLAAPIEERRAFPYRLKDRPERRIEIRTGDLRGWADVEVWVNSENTQLQMARFFDRNLSAVIRYCGAEKDENGEIVDDTIARELAEALGARHSVSLGAVYGTGSGALERTHGVLKIFHVAAVSGVPGAGYRAAPEIVEDCVRRCLERMDSAEPPLRSIAFPMIGTGAGGGDVREVAEILVAAATRYLLRTPESAVSKVVFMAWNGRDLEACLAAVEKDPALEPAES